MRTSASATPAVTDLIGPVVSDDAYGLGSAYSWTAQAGTTYYLQVNAYDAGEEGAFLLDIGNTCSLVANDGTLYINNLGQRWRSVTNLTTYNSAKDCIWENTRCTPQP